MDIFKKSTFIFIFLISIGLFERPLCARGRSGGGRISARSGASWGSGASSGYKTKEKLPSSFSSARSKNIKQENILNQGSFFNSRSNTQAKNGWGRGMNQRERAQAYEKRYTQPTTILNHRYALLWGSWGYGYASVGMWDLFFLSTVNNMFWYHHWNDQHIKQALYEKKILDSKALADLESQVKELEAQGIPRDPNYLPDDVTPDVAYAKEYVQNNNNQNYYIYILLFLVILFYFVFFRKY